VQRTRESNPTFVGFFGTPVTCILPAPIVDAYGLTKREGEITRLVVRGLSTAEVSGELHITPNTVRDHFKAIFDKVGVRSRRELVGLVFAQQYQPRMAIGREPDADGWFT
jgi:DNA-binding CsgD family transcriptional regulator